MEWTNQQKKTIYIVFINIIYLKITYCMVKFVLFVICNCFISVHFFVSSKNVVELKKKIVDFVKSVEFVFLCVEIWFYNCKKKDLWFTSKECSNAF